MGCADHALRWCSVSDGVSIVHEVFMAESRYIMKENLGCALFGLVHFV